jgi:ATP-dependent 26S proteasome regulatory subunit
MNLENTGEYRKEYYPYLDIDEMFKQFTLADESIMVVEGVPGLGKTKLVNMYIKYMLENGDLLDKDSSLIDALYVKNEDVLVTDEFWEYLKENKPSIVILDDIDSFLTTRTKVVNSHEDSKHNRFLSNLLSFSDGIFSEEKKIKFNQFLSSVKKNKEDKAKVDAILKLAKDKFKLSSALINDLKRAAGREVEA